MRGQAAEFFNPRLGKPHVRSVEMAKHEIAFTKAERLKDKAKFTHVEGKGWVNDTTKEVEALPADQRFIRFFNPPVSAPAPTAPK